MTSFLLVNIPLIFFLESLFRFIYVVVWTLSNVKEHINFLLLAGNFTKFSPYNSK